MKTVKICSIQGCTRKYYGKGFCDLHYKRWWKYGDPLEVKMQHSYRRGKCSVNGCDRPHEAKGFCRTHYRRHQRNGTTDTLISPRGTNKGNICKVDSCDEMAQTEGFCTRHYRRYKKWGDATKTYHDFIVPKICAVSYCHRKIKSAKYCQFHLKLIQAKGGTTASAFEEIYGNPPYKCYICGEEYDQCTSEHFQLDHIHPRSKGGKTTPDNVALACIKCNQSKRNLSIDEFIELCHKISKHNTP